MSTPQQGADPQQGTGAQEPRPQSSTDGTSAAPGNHAAGTSAEPVVLDVGKRAVKLFSLGGGVCALIGPLGIYSGLTGHVSGTSGTPAVIIGALFLLPALFVVASWRMLTRPRKFVLDATGITWDDPKGSPWSVRWDELGHVAVAAKTRQVRPQQVVAPRSHVYLDVYPGYRSFRQCHPEMENLWNVLGVNNGYRLILGPVPTFVPHLEEGLQRFRPQIYGGVRDN